MLSSRDLVLLGRRQVPGAAAFVAELPLIARGLAGAALRRASPLGIISQEARPSVKRVFGFFG